MEGRFGHSKPPRRGFYATLLALSLFVVFGFGALSVDLSYMRMTASQAQDVADAASQAATIMLRRTGDHAAATTVTKRVVSMNDVGSRPPILQGIQFGTWDQSNGSAGTFTADTTYPNAVRVTVSRSGPNAIPFILAPLLGYKSFGVQASATSATRNIDVVLVMDITNSWDPVNFQHASQAAVKFFDVMLGSAGPNDKIGMTVFTGPFAWEFTPLTPMRDATAAGVRTAWAGLRTASKGGDGTNWPSRCALKPLAERNDFTNPAGGCYPNMPREYTDEPGTDHTTGIELAAQMFESDPDPDVERVMLVLTDGIPNGISSTAGQIRDATGYVETRWTEYRGPRPHSTTDIESGSIAICQALWDNMRVHTYVVSFVQDGAFMHDMPHGQGYYTLTSDSTALVGIFQNIADALPLAIVE